MIAAAFKPGGIGVLLAGALAALIAMTALAAVLRWPVWSAPAAIAASVRVLSPDDTAGLSAATEALRKIDGVRRAIPMDSARASALLAAWTGEAAEPGALAGLALIEVDLDPRLLPGALETSLAQAGITAEVYAPPATAATQGAALGGFALAALVAAAALFGLIGAQRIAASARPLAVLADIGAAPNRVIAAGAWSGLRWGLACAGVACLGVGAGLGVLAPVQPIAVWIGLAGAVGAGALIAAGAGALATRALYGAALMERAP